MKDFYTSVVRSLTPAIVSAVVTFLTAQGINIDTTGVSGLESALYAFFYGLYYIVIRLLETHVHPKLGWLLGYAKAPQYTTLPLNTTVVGNGILDEGSK